MTRVSENNKDEEFLIEDILSLSSTKGIVDRKSLFKETYSKVNHKNYIKTRFNDLVYGKSISSSYPYGLFKANRIRDGLLSTLYFTFKPKNTVNPAYLDKYFSYQNRANNFLKKYVLVGDRYITADADYILSGKIHIPNILEQNKVVNLFDILDVKIMLLEENLQNLKLFKKGLATDLFNSLDAKEFLPITKLYKVKTGSKNNQDKVKDGIYPFFVRSENIESIDSYSYDEEAILIPGEGRIGDIYHYIEGKFEVHQRVYKISHNENKNNLKFLYHYMEATFKRHAMSFSVKATVDSLRMIVFDTFQVPIIEETLQSRVVFVLDELDKKLVSLDKKLETLKQFNGAQKKRHII